MLLHDAPKLNEYHERVVSKMTVINGHVIADKTVMCHIMS